MQDSPYSPPESRVADPVSSRPPRQIWVSIGLLTLAILVAVVRTAVGESDPYVMIATAITVLGIFGILIFGIYRGNYWARIVTTTLITYGAWDSVPKYVALAELSPVRGAVEF